MESTDSTPKPPAWASKTVLNAHEQIKRLDRTLELSRGGLRSVQAHPAIIEALRAFKPEIQQEDVARAEEAAEFLRDEIDRGFPLINSQALITLWAYLEFFTKDFVSEWIANNPSVLMTEPLSKIKIPIGVYTALEEEQKYRYLTMMLERDIGASISLGADRFELMFKAIGLAGKMPKKTRKIMFEFAHVRNNLAHNVGIVDLKLASACPWLELVIGEELIVDVEMCSKYFGEALRYLTLKILMIREAFDIDSKDELEAFFEDDT